MNPNKIGILFTNLGTPSNPTPKAVRRYLAQFLSDRAIVNIPRLLWWFILYGFILPIRPKRTAKLYQKIWDTSGSPLLSISSKLVAKLQKILQAKNHHFEVELGMRYGEPSLKKALSSLYQASVTQLVIFPLYPQYSKTTTGSTITEINLQLKKMNWFPRIIVIKDYHDDEGYIAALTRTIKLQWQKKSPSKMLLFSFHGLPQKSVVQGDPYFHQCQTTASLVAKQLGLTDSQWQIVFQSRFGKEKWLQPYCSQFLHSLAQNHCDEVDIICPGFSVDCLETLEEIAMTNKDIFLRAGGKVLNYIPALNDSDLHAQMLTSILFKKM